MHSPPPTTIGEAETFCSAIRPSSPMAHNRWTKISYRMGLSCVVAVSLMTILPAFRDNHVVVCVDGARVRRRDDNRGQRRLDNGRAADDRPRTEPGVIVDGRL